MRRLAWWGIAPLLFVVPLLGQALTLGNISVRSALNEAFDAEVMLTAVGSGDLESAQVMLASANDFRRAGIDRSGLLTQLRFDIDRRRDGTPVVRITSRVPIRDTFLDFLVELSSRQGRTVRHYTVLLDPPEVPAGIRAAPKVEAPRVAPARTGTIRRSPPRQTARAPSSRPAATPRSTPAQTSAQAPAREQAGVYGPTRRNDTLWNIARDTRPSSSVSMNQMMMALLRANPQAFSNYNVNNLKSGQMLQLPDESEITGVSRAEASRQFKQQYEDWKAGTPSAAPEKVEPQPVSPRMRADVAKAPPPTAAPEGELVLVAPPDDEGRADAAPGAGGDTGAATGPAAASGETLEALRRQRDLAEERAHTAAQETLELRRRTDELETRINDLERLLTLRDADLTAMQNRVAAPIDEAADESPVAAPESQPEPQVADEDATVADAGEPDTATPADEASSEPMVDDMATPVASPLDAALENWPLLAAGAGGIALLIGGGVVLARRRRGGDDELSDLADAEEPDIAAESDGDVIREVNQYLAYGRPQAAEERLKQEMAVDPERLELSVKLLEVYSRTGNKEAFDALAAETFTRMGNNPEHPDWRRIAGMGRRLSPNNPLYAPAAGPVSPPTPPAPPPRPAPAAPAPAAPAAAPAPAVAAAAATAAARPPEPARQQPKQDDIPAFDELEAELRRLEAEIGAAVAEDSDEAPSLDGLEAAEEVAQTSDEMDFDLSFDSDSSSDASVATDQPTKADDGGLDFDLSGLDAMQEPAAEPTLDLGDDGGLSFDADSAGLGDTKVMHGGAQAESPPVPAAASDDFDFGSLGDDTLEEGGADLDELMTKLDLARAYVDMDDKASAKDILDEVLQDATGKLREEAETLNQQLG